MKYDALQKAAVEASAELQHIVAEMERLEAQRVGLLARRESLQVIGQQLVAVMSMIQDDRPAEPAPAPEAPMAEALDVAAALPELRTEALPIPEPEPLPRIEEVPNLSPADFVASPADSVADPADSVPEEVAAKWPSLVELLARSKPSTLRDEGWHAVPQATHLELRELARAAD